MKVECSIIPQNKWSSFEAAYEDAVPVACDIAIQSFDELFKPKGIVFTDIMLWRKMFADVPTFQHLCFRYKNKVFSIILAIYGIEGANAAIMSEQEFDILIAECQKYNLTPCVFSVDVINKCPVLDGWHLLDALTKKPIDIEKFTDDNGKEVWSEWEYNNFGLTEVAKCLLHNGIGFQFIKWIDIMGFQPQLFFWSNNGSTKNYVIVRTIPAGVADEDYPINKRILEDLSDWNGYYAEIRVCSKWNTLDFQDTEIYRIASIFNPVVALEPIEEAIKSHKNIKLIDE